jgi:hypothetical protein
MNEDNVYAIDIDDEYDDIIEILCQKTQYDNLGDYFDDDSDCY